MCVQLLTRIPFYLECADDTMYFYNTEPSMDMLHERKRKVLHELEHKMKWIKHTGYVHLSKRLNSWDMRLQDVAT